MGLGSGVLVLGVIKLELVCCSFCSLAAILWMLFSPSILSGVTSGVSQLGIFMRKVIILLK
jgi:hypothetical protein